MFSCNPELIRHERTQLNYIFYILFIEDVLNIKLKKYILLRKISKKNVKIIFKEKTVDYNQQRWWRVPTDCSFLLRKIFAQI